MYRQTLFHVERRRFFVLRRTSRYTHDKRTHRQRTAAGAAAALFGDDKAVKDRAAWNGPALSGSTDRSVRGLRYTIV